LNYKYEVQGKGCISAKIVADSISEQGQRITTFEIEYPRFILAELNTHRLFSRNSMSSRAVPISKMIEQVRDAPAMPIHWGKNQAGMQAKEECKELVKDNIGNVFHVEDWWQLSADEAADAAELMDEAGYHKQVVNRLLEPFQIMKTVVTATSFDNFFYLRCHADAQPEIKELADCMHKCYVNSVPEILFSGEWHTPYVGHKRDPERKNEIMYRVGKSEWFADPVIALKISASCCAQVSYRLLDNSIEKAIMIYDKLVESKPAHASPFEHQASPMKKHTKPFSDSSWEKGVTHCDVNGYAWSGNLKGWIQFRQTLDNHTCWEYKDE
jgi:thymidylate synthase ThyX